ncbi:trans-sialidase [Trypanosoma conorhini]|uniref:Trans-sialidase n=1 Tax=Trypanosoma conorhini TaxID=83891 RepID=A0A3R7PFP1_9TRYP|nr:trans-sialidase [Trypanosoma conorhini]RNF19102.1 trans-sialidase [Trypanosoma conorhini]
MPQHPFSSAVLLLVLMCCGSGEAASTPGESTSNKVELFTPGTVQSTAASGQTDTTTSLTVSSYFGHSLVDVKGVLVALAVGKYTGSSGNGDADAGIWAKYKTYGTGRNVGQGVAEQVQQWGTQQLVSKELKEEDPHAPPFGPKALVKDNKIFLLVSSVSSTGASSQSGADRGLALIVGSAGTAEATQQVTWENPQSLKTTLDAQMQKNSWEEVEPAPGARGVVVGGNTILFPLVATGDPVDAEEEIRACTVMYSDDNGSSWNFPAAPVRPKDCDSVTLLEWAGKVFMATSVSPSWQRRVYESSDKGKTWKEAAGSFARLLSQSGVLPMLYGPVELTTATVADKRVLLFTQMSSSRTAPGDNGGRGTFRRVIHLWLSDGARTHDVGPISADDAGEALFSSLLYTNDELFALYAKVGESGSSQSLVFCAPPQSSCRA